MNEGILSKLSRRRELHAKLISDEYVDRFEERIVCDSLDCAYAKGPLRTKRIQFRMKLKNSSDGWKPWSEKLGTMVTHVGEDDVVRHFHRGCPRE